MLQNPLESIFRPNVHAGYSAGIEPRSTRLHLRNRSLFLIEENMFVRHSMKDFLGDLGLKTKTFSSGWDAAKFIERHNAKPNIVLFDLGHSIVRSWPALMRVRSVVGEMPMIISSGLEDSLFKHEIEALGGCVYMQKPFTYERLAGHISRFLLRKV